MIHSMVMLCTASGSLLLNSLADNCAPSEKKVLSKLCIQHRAWAFKRHQNARFSTMFVCFLTHYCGHDSHNIVSVKMPIIYLTFQWCAIKYMNSCEATLSKRSYILYNWSANECINHRAAERPSAMHSFFVQSLKRNNIYWSIAGTRD